jgi:hypothetical protein
MRINPKPFTLTLVLTTLITATSAVAASQPAKSREDRGPRDPGLITRIIDVIKRHLPTTSGDGIVIPPPAPNTPPAP